eukprot:2299043-Heterocapsa_arctica.AAC.1
MTPLADDGCAGSRAASEREVCPRAGAHAPDVVVLEAAVLVRGLRVTPEQQTVILLHNTLFKA